MKQKFSTRKLVVASMLSAVSVVLGLTPLGIIPLPIANLTTMHIPAILGGILEGPVVGLLVGLIFGLTSLYKAVTAPSSILSPFLIWYSMPKYCIAVLTAAFWLPLPRRR